MNLAARFASALGVVILVSGMSLAPAALAQVGGAAVGTSGAQSRETVNQMQTELHDLTDVQRQNAIDPAEVAAYKKFYRVSSQDADEKIQLGNKFRAKYPHSPFTEDVDVGLTNAYLAKQDWKDFYRFANQVLTLNPDEVDILTTVGWVIPHQFDPDGGSPAQQLQKAEADEKHALDLLPKMPKPKHVSAQQFAAMKAQKSQQAHSALGLVYFRRGDYADSVKELQQSTQGGTGVDETDMFVLGVDLQNLNRHADAAKAFARCSKMGGPLQARCKEAADQESHSAGGGH